MEFSHYKLKNNPFRIAPAISPNDIIWVGMDKLKNKIENRLIMGVKTSPSRIILNWGRYGSGKTHAANYFTKTDFIESEIGVKTKNIKVNLPRDPKQPVQSFLRAIIGQLDYDSLLKDFRTLKAEFPNLDEIVDANTQDSLVSKFIKQLTITDRNLFPGYDEHQIAMKNYLYGDKSKATLEKIGVPLGVEDDEQVVNLLSGILNCLTHEKRLYQAVFLWVDEFEDVDTLPKGSQDRLTTFFRQLLDKTPNNLNLFLNFTLKGYGDVEDLSISLGEALASRTRIIIEFDSPSIEEAQEYIRGLMNHPKFKNEEDIRENGFFPFTKPSVEYVLSHIGRLSIRRINETFSLIMELALLNDPIPEEINLEFINSVKSELISWEE